MTDEATVAAAPQAVIPDPGANVAQPAPRDRKAELDALIDQWHAAHFRGNAVARNVECWNIVHRATEALKESLTAFIKEA